MPCSSTAESQPFAHLDPIDLNSVQRDADADSDGNSNGNAECRRNTQPESVSNSDAHGIVYIQQSNSEPDNKSCRSRYGFINTNSQSHASCFKAAGQKLNLYLGNSADCLTRSACNKCRF